MCVCGLSLLPPRLNGSPVCDDSAAELVMRKCYIIESYLDLFLLSVVIVAPPFRRSSRHPQTS